MDRRIDESIKHVFTGRVIWRCNGCSATQLVPVTGQTYQPRNWVKLEQIPPQLVNAVIAVEDRRFYSHGGIDYVRMGGAMATAAGNAERPRGTSTLTQQLAKLLFTSGERTLSRKLREAVHAIGIESALSKREILELYLNIVPFGNAGPYEIVGVAEASAAFLGKELSALDIADIALITSAIQRPSNLTSRNSLTPARNRRDIVLAVLRKRGTISEAQERDARSKLVRLAELPTKNAHYLQLAAREMAGAQNGGRPVEAWLTLDPRLQTAAVEAVRRGIERLTRRAAGADAALVALDPATGAVRALVGGSNFLTSQVNRAVALRQPGSVFKPFVYAAAFEHGSRAGALGPFSEVNDIPRDFLFRGEKYAPRNYGDNYHGRVTLQQALHKSLNVPAVRLAETVGYARVSEMAKAAGLDGVASTPSAALGSYEVSPLALAGAYAAFANGGLAVKPYFVERVRALDGASVRESPARAVRVMRAETAGDLAMLLRGVVQYGTAWEAGRLAFAAAGKTGTDDDGWFAGFAGRLVCVVWVGYDDNRDLKLKGADSALPIWMHFMREVHAMKDYRFGKELARAWGRTGWTHHVDPPLPEDFDLQQLLASRLPPEAANQSRER